MRIGIGLLGLLMGCLPDDGTPVWAIDPIYLEPTADEGVYGFQSWHLYSERWASQFSPRYHVCSVVVELVGAAVPSPQCAECTKTWEVMPTLLEHDCDEEVAANPTFLSIRRVGLAQTHEVLEDGDPHPSSSTGGVVRYGNDYWEYHGWAYPETLDEGDPAPATWDGEHTFVWWPAWVWDLHVRD
jgi:hypothetical protein